MKHALEHDRSVRSVRPGLDRTLLCLLATLLGLPLAARAADQQVLGSSFVLRNPSTSARRSLVVKARERHSDDTLVGDPVASGATLEVTTYGGASSGQTFALPAGVSAVTHRPFWTGDAGRGFTYRDPRGENGPVKQAQIKLRAGTFQIAATVSGKLGPITVLPPNPGTSACARLSLAGGDSYGVRFAGGRITNRGTTTFSITSPPSAGSCAPAQLPPPAAPPIAFQEPAAVLADGASIDLHDVKAVPRLTDWDADGAVDLLVFSGDGYVLRYMAAAATTSASFQSPTRLRTVDGADIRIGTGYTGGALVDLNGDGRRDLVATGNDHRVRLYANVGTSIFPAFSGYVNLQTGAGDLALPSGNGGRIDVVDWDGDGLLDLVAGDFGGSVTFYRNTGSPTGPAFAAAGIAITADDRIIAEPYNTHPRAFDLNVDGVPDLAYGVNWHYFRLCPRASASSNDVGSCFGAATLDGQGLNLRDESGDDSTPDFADLNGDGVLDMIDGGTRGRVVVLYGVPYTEALAAIDGIMAAHPSDLGPTLGSNTSLRDELFGRHRLLRSFVARMASTELRVAIRDWYAAHIAQYAQYFIWQTHDKDAEDYVSLLAGQTWIVLFESMPDTPAHRAFVASACGFSGMQAQLLTEAGTIFIENHMASSDQQQVLRDLQMSLPGPYRVVESVTVADWLVPTGVSILDAPRLSARTGVNIFSTPVGACAEGFPPDAPNVLVDCYAVAIAHELNHNVEAPAAKLFPGWYRQRKSELLKEASPPSYQWTANPDGTYGWDEAATKQVLLASGHWDGVEAHWEAALDAYWATGPAAGYEQHWCRDNLRFSIKNPGEAFATLANIYFDSSETLLELGLDRFANGNPYCLDQMLFFAEVYALGGSTTSLYRVDTLGHVTRSDVAIRRGPGGHIDGLTLPDGTDYDFDIAPNGDVLAVH